MHIYSQLLIVLAHSKNWNLLHLLVLTAISLGHYQPLICSLMEHLTLKTIPKKQLITEQLYELVWQKYEKASEINGVFNITLCPIQRIGDYSMEEVRAYIPQNLAQSLPKR